MKSYETAWAWLHKFRRAMAGDVRGGLRGRVEVGEVFVGGIAADNAGALRGDVCVMVAAELSGEQGARVRRIRLGLADRPGGSEIIAFVRNAAQAGTVILSEQAPILRRLPEHGFVHESISAETPGATEAPLAGVREVAGGLHRWLTGPLHYGVARHQLPYYLDEFTFRFNEGRVGGGPFLFYRLLEQASRTGPRPLGQLLDPEHNPYTGFVR